MLDISLLSSNLCDLAENCGDCECQAQKWANAMKTYSENIAPPSTSVVAATEALEIELMSIFILHTEASAQMELAFANFANAIALGMLPAYVGTPPPGIVNFSNIFSMEFPNSCEEGAQRFTNAIDTWMKTGTATPSAGGSPIGWT